jgi:26S proteasome regulatory subunit T1
MSKSPSIYTDNRVLTSSRDIQVLKTYGAAPYGAALKKLEQQIKERQTSVNEKIGVKVSSGRIAGG